MDGGLTSKKGVMMVYLLQDTSIPDNCKHTAKAQCCVGVYGWWMLQQAACDYKAVDHPIVSQHSQHALPLYRRDDHVSLANNSKRNQI